MNCIWGTLHYLESNVSIQLLKNSEGYLPIKSNAFAKRYLANIIASIVLPIFALIELSIWIVANCIYIPMIILKCARDPSGEIIPRGLRMLVQSICVIIISPFILVANIFGANYLSYDVHKAHFLVQKAAVKKYQEELNIGKKPSFSALSSMCMSMRAPSKAEEGDREPSAHIVNLLIRANSFKDDRMMMIQLEKLVKILLGPTPTNALAFIASNSFIVRSPVAPLYAFAIGPLNGDPVKCDYLGSLLETFDHGNVFNFDIHALYEGESLIKKILLGFLEPRSDQFFYQRSSFLNFLSNRGVMISRQEVESLPITFNLQNFAEVFPDPALRNPGGLLSLLLQHWAARNCALPDQRDQEGQSYPIDDFIKKCLIQCEHSQLEILAGLLKFIDDKEIEKLQLTIKNRLKSDNKVFSEITHDTPPAQVGNKSRGLIRTTHIINNLIGQAHEAQFAFELKELEERRLAIANTHKTNTKDRAWIYLFSGFKPSGLYQSLLNRVHIHEKEIDEKVELLIKINFVPNVIVVIVATFLRTQRREPASLSLLEQHEDLHEKEIPEL